MLQTKLFQLYQKGQGLVEYAVIVIVVVVIAIAVGSLFRGQIVSLFEALGSTIGLAPGIT